MSLPTEHRIWHVPKMVEAILSQLPARVLLRSKAVCKTWTKTIKGSIKLKKVLFLVPEGEPWSSLTAIDEARREAFEAAATRSCLRPNPLLAKTVQRLQVKGGPYRIGLGPGDFSNSSTMPRAESPFWTTLLTQPAIQSHNIRVWFENEGKIRYRKRAVYVKMEKLNGLTMVDVAKAVEKAFFMARSSQCYHYGTFFVAWRGLMEATRVFPTQTYDG